MKTIFSIVFMFCTLFCSAQLVDLNKESMSFGSSLEQVHGEEKPFDSEHLITIDTKQKSIQINKKKSGDEVYTLSYTSAYDGNSRNVQLNPGEALFFLKHDSLSMLAYSEQASTFSVIDKENRIHLFGQIYLIEN